MVGKCMIAGHSVFSSFLFFSSASAMVPMPTRYHHPRPSHHARKWSRVGALDMSVLGILDLINRCGVLAAQDVSGRWSRESRGFVLVSPWTGRRGLVISMAYTFVRS